jgi:hypothetical protein
MAIEFLLSLFVLIVAAFKLAIKLGTSTMLYVVAGGTLVCERRNHECSCDPHGPNAASL